MHLEIKPAELFDADFIVGLLKYMSDFHSKARPDLFNAGYPKFNREETAALINDASQLIYIALVDGVRAGYIICCAEEPADKPVLKKRKLMYIHDLCVDENYRNSGAGSALMEKALELARENCCESIELNVYEFQGSALGFYEKFGMSTMARKMELKL